MTINTVYIHDGTRYFIKNAGGGDICYFDSLETAGIVLRYLTGADMPPEDCAHAVEAMRGFDAAMAEQAERRAAERAERRERYRAKREAQEAAQQAAGEGIAHDDPE